MYTYKHIVEQGEVSCDIMVTVLNKMGYVKDLNVKVSNGMSFVFVSSEKKNVYQYFSNINTPRRIFYIISKLWKNKIINIEFYFGSIRYNLYDYISRFISFIPDNIIVWKKHCCLNSFDKESISKIISTNYFKLLWDISKGLYGLHINNVMHGDARIDNIGILDNNFILFDFDGSCIIENTSEDVFEKDISDFLESIRFHSGKNWKYIEKYIPKVDYTYNFIGKIISNYSKFVKNKVTYSQLIIELNNLKIEY